MVAKRRGRGPCVLARAISHKGSDLAGGFKLCILLLSRKALFDWAAMGLSCNYRAVRGRSLTVVKRRVLCFAGLVVELCGARPTSAIEPVT